MSRPGDHIVPIETYKKLRDEIDRLKAENEQLKKAIRDTEDSLFEALDVIEALERLSNS